ncbi:MAG: hypothetical protein PHV39_06535 [Methanomicrobium sp.]|nr:hypothetical protein [Methanomicrobium sp.]
MSKNNALKSIIFSSALVFLLILGAVITAGCTGNSDDDKKTPVPTPLKTEEQKITGENTTEINPDQTPERFDEAKYKNIYGTGNKTTELYLPKGVSLFKLMQDSPVKSQVSITTIKDAFSINNVYNISASKNSMDDTGYYWTYAFSLEDDANASVEVETEGNWTLSFSFPLMINGIVPQTFRGAANKATPFFQINEGDYNFTIITENSEFASVTLMDYYGNNVMNDNRQMPLSFHYGGSYDNTINTTINESCNYLLNVFCDGDWTVSVEEA